VVVVWLALFVGSGVGALTLSGDTDDGFSIPGTESQQALQLLDERFPGTGGASARVVVAAPAGAKVTEAPYNALTERALAEVARAPQVLAVSASPQQVSEDGRIGFAALQYAVPVEEITDEAKEALRDIAEPLRAAGLQVEFSGGVISTTEAHGASAEVFGIAVGFIVLAITLGSFVAAGLPILLALLGVGITTLGIQVLTGFVELNSTTPALATMLGLAVGIDYALFLIARHRSQTAAGMPVAASVALATGTAGGAIVFAGSTVIIALAALALMGIPFLTAMGLAAAAGVALTVVISLTLAPAVLSLLGPRLDAGRLRSPRRRAGVRRNDVAPSRPWARRWAELVTRRPGMAIASVLAICLLMALPALDLRLGLPDDSAKSEESTERRAYDLLTDGFGAGFNGPLTVLIDDLEGKQAAAVGAEAQRALAAAPGVVAVSPPIPNQAGDLAILSVTPASAPASAETKALV